MNPSESIRLNETDASVSSPAPQSCRSISGESGFYEINPEGASGTVEVFCDLNSNDEYGSGWTRLIANDYTNSFNASKWSLNSNNKLVLRSPPSVLAAECDANHVTTEFIRKIDDLGLSYDEVRVEGRWIARDSWDSEDIVMEIGTGSGFVEKVRRTYQHDGTGSPEPFTGIDCSRWASDTDNQGPFEAVSSTSQVDSLRFKLGDDQSDSDESLSFDYLRVFVR